MANDHGDSATSMKPSPTALPGTPARSSAIAGLVVRVWATPSVAAPSRLQAPSASTAANIAIVLILIVIIVALPPRHSREVLSGPMARPDPHEPNLTSGSSGWIWPQSQRHTVLHRRRLP